MADRIATGRAGEAPAGASESATLEALLEQYGWREPRLEVINRSENTTYRVSGTGRPDEILRVCPPAYRSEAEIESELAWMDALRADAGISTPKAVRTRDGRRIAHLITGRGAAPCVVFELLAGIEPAEDALPDWFDRLGEICARIHRHAQDWRRPAGFVRRRLDWDSLVGAAAVWGPWQIAPGLDAAAVRVLERTSAALRERVARYGSDGERFGLIHGDLRLANLLANGDELHVIDFDDCATSWHLFDLATALSLIEDLAVAAELVRRWLVAYCRVRPLDGEDLAMVPHLIMLRRLQVVSWFGSHADTDVARRYGPVAVPATVAAGEDYLSGRPRLASVL